MTGVADLDDRLISGEEVVFSTSKHWFALVADSKWAILMIVVALAAGWLQSDSTTGIGGFLNRSLGLIQQGLWLGALGWIAYNFIAWRSAEYHVTNRRVLGQDGPDPPADDRYAADLDLRREDRRPGNRADARLRQHPHHHRLRRGRRRQPHLDPRGRRVPARDPRAEDRSDGAALPPLRRLRAAVAAAAGSSSAEITATLGELARLRDAGAITAAEFEAKKAELLARI